METLDRVQARRETLDGDPPLLEQGLHLGDLRLLFGSEGLEPLDVPGTATVGGVVLAGVQQLVLREGQREGGRLVAVLELGDPQNGGDLPQLERDRLVQLERLDGLDHLERLASDVLERLDLLVLAGDQLIEVLQALARATHEDASEDATRDVADDDAEHDREGDEAEQDGQCRDPGGGVVEHVVSLRKDVATLRDAILIIIA